MALFPIHDLGRADDIRMRRRRTVLLLAGIGVLGWRLLGPDDAGRHRRDRDVTFETQPRHDMREPVQTFRTSTTAVVAVDLPCANSVTLLPRQGLGDQVTLLTRPGQEAALQAVWFTDGRLGQSDACETGSADFTLQMAADRAVRIVQSGSTDIHGGSFSGTVGIEVRGSGGVTLAAVGTLDDVQTGSGDVAIGRVFGRVNARLDGSGDLRVRGGTVLMLDAASNGSGDIDMGGATIGGGRVELGGSGDFGASAINGGSFTAETSSSGDVAIERLNVGEARLRGNGSGDITVRGGIVGQLEADRTGSGDLLMDAAVSSGQVSHGGSGDVRLPHAAAAVVRNDND